MQTPAYIYKTGVYVTYNYYFGYIISNYCTETESILAFGLITILSNKKTVIFLYLFSRAVYFDRTIMFSH